MSVNTPNKREYKTNISVIAYMDDLLWIVDTKKQWEEILEIALSFYRMTGIIVNANKSTYLTNANDDDSVLFREEILEKRKEMNLLDAWVVGSKRRKSKTKYIGK